MHVQWNEVIQPFLITVIKQGNQHLFMHQQAVQKSQKIVLFQKRHVRGPGCWYAEQENW